MVCNAQVGTAALHPLGSCQAGWLLQDGTSKAEQFLAAITAPIPASISHDHTLFFLALTFQEPWQKSTNPGGKAEPAT